MLDDLGIDAAYTHDGSDHKELREIAQIDPDKTRYRRDRVLFMARDPRDTAVSGFFQVGKRHHLQAGSIGDFVRSAQHGIEKIALFNLQWFAAARQMKNIALLRYEDMQRDTEGTLRAIGDFIGRHFADSDLADVTYNRSFERMRQSEASGELGLRYGGKLRPRDLDDPESFKVLSMIPRASKCEGVRSAATWTIWMLTTLPTVTVCSHGLITGGNWTRPLFNTAYHTALMMSRRQV